MTMKKKKVLPGRVLYYMTTFLLFGLLISARCAEVYASEGGGNGSGSLLIGEEEVSVQSGSISGKKKKILYNGQDYSRIFDYSYYAERYPAVKEKCGSSRKKLLRDFVKNGMKKGRQGIASFDVISYIYGNPDLRKKYKNNLEKYYLHYQNKGYAKKKRVKTAVGIKKMQHPVTVYKGIDYAPVYDYSYYIKKNPRLRKKYRYRDAAVLRYFVKNDYPRNVKAKRKVTDNDRSAVLKQLIARDLPKTETAKKAGQIIVVVDHELSLWQKNADGSFRRRLHAYCGYGKNGMSSNRHAGDMTTPIGSFPILHAFGTAEDAVTDMTWKQITKYSYWSSERNSTYNTWVESTSGISGEHLINYYQYVYAMAIGFNRDPVVLGRGSAIFLHCKSYDRWYTAGCVSVKNNVMKKLLKYCKDGTYILIVPEEERITEF